MKLIHASLLAFSARQTVVEAKATTKWQTVGFCGVPQVEFDQKVITDKFSGRAGVSNEVNPDRTSDVANDKIDMLEKCAAKLQEERADNVSKRKAKADLDRLDRACFDYGDNNYDRKVLEAHDTFEVTIQIKVGDQTESRTETRSMLTEFEELKTLFDSAALNSDVKVLQDHVNRVDALINAILNRGKSFPCSRAYSRKLEVAELNQFTGDGNKMVKENPKNEDINAALEIIQECEEDDLKVVGGQDANAHAWPWQVYLSICGTFYGQMECNVCGGSIISDKWIITAAHCVPYEASGRISVGAHNLDQNNYRVYQLGPMLKHPLWNYPGRFENDVALTHPVGERMHIDWKQSSPICLPDKDSCFQTDTTCVVTGWGLTSEGGQQAKTLQVVGVNLMDKAQCMGYKGYEALAETMICAGFKSGKFDACSGDSGGPLVCRMSSGPTKGAWVLHGVVSWGYGCARPGSPGIYTDVKAYLPWIDSVTNGDEPNVDGGLRPDDRLADTKECQANIYEDDTEGFIPVPTEIKHEDLNFDVPEHRTCSVNSFKAFENPEDSAPGSGLRKVQVHSLNADGEITTSTETVDNTIQHTIVGDRYNDEFCKWEWTNLNPDTYIEVRADVDLMANCGAFDTKVQLEITYYDDNMEMLRTVTPCSVRKTLTFKSKSYIKIEYITFERVIEGSDGHGFLLQWKFGDNTQHCLDSDELNFLDDKSLHNEAISLTAPRYPGPRGRNSGYKGDQQCRWHVTSNYDVRIFVKDLQTERRRQCDTANDNLIFYLAEDCSTKTLTDSSHHSVFGVLCGSYRNKLYRIEKKLAPSGKPLSVCIVFMTDGDDYNGRGFHIEVSPIIPSSGPKQTHAKKKGRPSKNQRPSKGRPSKKPSNKKRCNRKDRKAGKC